MGLEERRIFFFFSYVLYLSFFFFFFFRWTFVLCCSESEKFASPSSCSEEVIRVLYPPRCPSSRNQVGELRCHPFTLASYSSRLNSSQKQPCQKRHPIGTIVVIPTGTMGGRTADLLTVRAL